MHTIFAGIHIPEKTNEVLPLRNIDFEKNIEYLRGVIAAELKFDAKDLELIYNGKVLNDDLQPLSSLIKPNGTVHCFHKTFKYQQYVPPSEIDIKHVQELFSLTAHIQISVTSRVNVLQKIINEYPEFRRNMGAQALIRDSVLFNTLHEVGVIENIAKNYPLICQAAPYIVDTIRKELARNNSATNFSSEQAASDSTTSSEEENSLGASGSSSTDTFPSNSNRNSENSQREEIRLITRQQLANALARVNVGSANSLANIANRESDVETNGAAQNVSSDTTTTTNNNTAPSMAAVPATSGSTTDTNDERQAITSDLFRHYLRRAFDNINRRNAASSNDNTSESMDTSESSAPAAVTADEPSTIVQDAADPNDILPVNLRPHKYAAQLRTMALMGFTDYTLNLNYLLLTEGNVENAINLLIQN